jgi:hypothetical protein
LGKPNYRWRVIYANNISDGNYTVAVADIATRTELAAASTLPAVTSLDNGLYLGVRNGRWSAVVAPTGVLPLPSAADNGKYLTVYNGQWRMMTVSLLPAVTTLDNGMIMRVVGGVWTKFQPPPLLPLVGDQDDGKILQVASGQWAAVAPPVDVLPLATLADHGMLLAVQHGTWSKRRIDLASMTVDGLAPRLPGSPGRVLVGDNTWAAMPTGASGQWRIGDVKMTGRAPDYGWLPADGSALAFDDAYKALYMVLGGDETGWGDETPVNVPNRPGCHIRYLPDAQAAAEFGILLDVPGSDDPLHRLHFELEIYREATPAEPVMMIDTRYKVSPVIDFTAPTGAMSSSAPGWFWHDRANDVWRLYDVDGERAEPADRAQVLVDLAEVPAAALQYGRMTPGSFYYRYRQTPYTGGAAGSPGDWRWGRILSTGGMSGESSQLTKLCDVFSCGRAQRWVLPRTAARVFAASSRIMVEEGQGVTVDDACGVTVDEGSARGARVTVIGQGYLQRNINTVNALDVFSIVPQYTATVVRTEGVNFAETATGKANHLGWRKALAFNSATGRADNPNCVLALPNSGNISDHLLVNLENFTLSFLTSSYSGVGDMYEALGMGDYTAATGAYNYLVPPVNSLAPRRITRSGGTALTAIVGDDAWEMPYFRHVFNVNGVDYYLGGEVEGVWDTSGELLIPLPAGTRFRGSKAACIGADGCIYCLPRFTWSNTVNTNSTGMLRFDPHAKAIDFVPVPWNLVALKYDHSGWSKALLLRDGRILFVPLHESNFVIFDPVTDSFVVSTFGVNLPSSDGGGAKWSTAFVMADGSVCGFGTDITSYGSLCFRFNPDTGKAALFTFPRPINAGIRAGTVLPDGSVLLFPFTNQASNTIFLVSAGDMPYTPCTASPVINHP